MNVRPLITICGTTGVGKSNLAIELALHLARGARADGWKGARIINADSMQVYSGMDVITNKVPESERRGIEHLLMGFKAPGEQYIVGQWVQDALQVIEETHNRKEIPIVVGGTSYWIQHLLFPNRLAPTDTRSTDCSTPPMSPDLVNAIMSLPSQLLVLFNDLPEHPPSATIDPDAAFNLHALLTILDPLIATRWHWRDTRKVLRSLSIIKESGRRTSEIIAEQSNTPTNSPRFRTLCFWLYAEPSVLETRLNERVDKMIEEGLLNEIRSLRKIAEASILRDPNTGSGSTPEINTDYTLGIYQSIGYKEFHHYLSSLEPSDKAFQDAVDHMRLSTRQYAKRQISWIRNKLLPAVNSANAKETVLPTYLLDATGESLKTLRRAFLTKSTPQELGDHWTTRVQNAALQITEDFLSQKELPDPVSLSDNALKMLRVERKPINPASVLSARRKLICPVCTLQADRPFMVEEGQEWDAHKKTRMHKRLAAKAARQYSEDDRWGKRRMSKSNDDATDSGVYLHDGVPEVVETS